MSSIKKGVKKVFKSVKKVVKKYHKEALIIGASLFTAGVASGGFSAFSSMGSGAGLGGFFGAVGKTISQGASTLTGGILGSPMSGGGGAGAGIGGGGGFGGGLGLSGGFSGGTSATGGGSGKGFLGNVMGALGSFASTDTGKMIIAQGVMGGIQSFAAARQADKERKRFNKESIFGVKRQGSGGESLLSAKLPDLMGGNQPAPSAEQYAPSAESQQRQGLLGHQTATPAPTQNASPAWGDPAPMPIQGNIGYDYSYSYGQQGQQGLLNPYGPPQQITPIGPNYG